MGCCASQASAGSQQGNERPFKSGHKEAANSVVTEAPVSKGNSNILAAVDISEVVLDSREMQRLQFLRDLNLLDTVSYKPHLFSDRAFILCHPYNLHKAAAVQAACGGSEF